MSGPQYPGPDPSNPGGTPPQGPDLGKGGPAGPPPGAYPPPPQGSYPPPQGSYPPPPQQGGFPPPAPPVNAGQYGQPDAVNGIGAPASLGVRFGARVIDSLVVGIPVYIINLVLFWTAPWILALLVSIVLAFAGFLYFVYFETQKAGTTVGKKLLKLKVVGAQGGVPTTDESAKRNSWMLLGVLSSLPIIFLGFIFGLIWLGLVIAIAVTINGDPRNQGWHDKFAGGTTVVRTA